MCGLEISFTGGEHQWRQTTPSAPNQTRNNDVVVIGFGFCWRCATLTAGATATSSRVACRGLRVLRSRLPLSRGRCSRSRRLRFRRLRRWCLSRGCCGCRRRLRLSRCGAALATGEGKGATLHRSYTYGIIAMTAFAWGMA